MKAENIYRWGVSLGREHPERSGHAIAALLKSLPRGNVHGVSYTYNQTFDRWLKTTLPLFADFLSDRTNDRKRATLESALDTYLEDCLPMTQPQDATLVDRAEDWDGVQRLVKARWYNKGYIPQHRMALALRSIWTDDMAKHLGEMTKCFAGLLGSQEAVKETVLAELEPSGRE